VTDTSSDISQMLPNRVPACPNRRILLFAMRRMAAGGLNDAHATHALLSIFGMRFRRPLLLLRALMAEMSRVAGHKVTVAPCCCPRMTGAEAALLDAVAVSIADPHGAHDALATVLGVRHCLGALSSAQALHQAFADLGRPLE